MASLATGVDGAVASDLISSFCALDDFDDDFLLWCVLGLKAWQGPVALHVVVVFVTVAPAK